MDTGCTSRHMGAPTGWVTHPAFPSHLPTGAPWVALKVKVAQSCPTLCHPIDYIVHWLLQARILEWVAFPLPRGSSQSRNRTRFFCIAGGFFTNWAIREALAVLKSGESSETSLCPVQGALLAGAGDAFQSWVWWNLQQRHKIPFQQSSKSLPPSPFVILQSKSFLIVTTCVSPLPWESLMDIIPRLKDTFLLVLEIHLYITALWTSIIFALKTSHCYSGLPQ